MPSILRSNLELAKKLQCPREPDFLDMYGKDSEDQDKIRDLNKNVKHCRFLKDSASACDELPYDVGDEKAGNPCPNNPFHKYEKFLKDREDDLPVIREAQEWESMIDLNMLPPVGEITAIQFAFASVVSKFASAKEMMIRSASGFGGMTSGGGQGEQPQLPQFPRSK